MLKISKNNVDKIIKDLDEHNMVMPVISDTVFRSLFKDEEMRGILSFIISEVIGIDKNYIYENLRFRDSHQKKENITHKDNTSDLIVDIVGGIILLEMNVENTIYTRFRNVAHFHSQIVNNILVSKSKDEVKNLYQINFDVKRNAAGKLISKIMMKDEDGMVDIDEISFQKYKVNISFLDKKSYNISGLTRFEKILLIMKENKKDILSKLASGDKELEKMVEKIEKMSKDPSVVSLYDEERLDKLARDYEREEMREEGEAIGRAAGLKEGRAEGEAKLKETVKNLLKEKVDINIISKVTGMTIEEIQNL